MTQSSQRIAAFVTPAQKRALTTKAQSLGISVSELVRRAVLAFEETADEVRAARIVDSWQARPAADSLNETLRRIANAAPSLASRVAYGPASQDQPETPALSAVSGCGGEVDDVPAASSQPIPVAAAVARALACEPVEAACTEDGEPLPSLDLDTVTRLTSRWSETPAAATPDSARRPARKRFMPRLA